MTVQQIREHFQWLVDDDTLDEDRELALMNVAYDEIHAERTWRFLDASDEQTIVSGDTTYALPADFLRTTKVVLYDGDKTYMELKSVPFSRRLEFKDVSGYYYVDFKNAMINLLSSDDSETFSGWTLIHEYQYQPAQLASASEEPVFNRAFHPILAYKMAKHYFFNDQGEKSRAWNGEFQAEYNDLHAKLVAWDSALDYGTNDGFNAVGAFDSIT